ESVGMTDKANYKPGQLSIGQQQRIAIARAISHRPELILADEPTGNLDSANSERILQLFREVHQQSGVTVVMITHSPSAAQWADRVVQMTDGKILYD
ncbi:MAG: ATP-binding cassette domain-containing protein, partial [Sedimentisphaerales bacterium]|nr:ATP-binding cassette domain-containing protein [Sedimentisphaerales bacterium]